MSRSGQEIELKLEVAQDAQGALKRVGTLQGFSASRAVTKTLHSIYFDTPDQSLRKAKISLRVRKSGRSWVQTVKLGTGVVAGVSSAVEAEHPVKGRAVEFSAIEDPSVAAALETVLNGQPVSECFETIMKRTTRVLTRDSDGSEIELAFDNGNILAGDAVRPLLELEMELKSGAGTSLFEAAKALLADTPFRFSPCSKAERGYRLAEGDASEPLKPKLAAPITYPEGETVERAFRNVLRSCLEQMAENRVVILGSDDPEGPHQMRVALRRLRSAFRLFKPALNPATALALDAKARELAAEAGALRDLDVLVDEIVAPLTDVAPEGVRFDGLIAHLQERREAVRTALTAHLASDDVNAFLMDLAAYTEGRGWLDPNNLDQTIVLAQPLQRFSADALKKQWKKVGKFGARIDDLTIPERHDMRKALKKMRYGIEFFADLYPPDTVKPFLKRMKKLQDIFGYLNDVAMAEKLSGLNGLSGKAAVEAAEGTGFVIGWHEAQSRVMWQHAKGYWDDTRKTTKFWL